MFRILAPEADLTALLTTSSGWPSCFLNGTEKVQVFRKGTGFLPAMTTFETIDYFIRPFNSRIAQLYMTIAPVKRTIKASSDLQQQPGNPDPSFPSTSRP